MSTRKYENATRAHCWHLAHESDLDERTLYCCACRHRVMNEEIITHDTMCPDTEEIPWTPDHREELLGSFMSGALDTIET